MAEVRNRQRLIDERVALYRDLKSNFWDPRYRDPYFLVQNAPVGPESSQYGPIIVKHGVPLRDIIDVEQLVIKHELRKNGIEPGEIRIVLVGPLSTYSYPDYNYMAIGSDAFDGPPENLYVAAIGGAGSLTLYSAVAKNAEAGDIRLIISPTNLMVSTGILTVVGIVSGMLPAIRAARLDPIDQESLAIERQERAYAAMPVLSRRPPEAPRPIYVRRYTRWQN